MKPPDNLADLDRMIRSGRLVRWTDERDAAARTKALAKDISAWDTAEELKAIEQREKDARNQAPT